MQHYSSSGLTNGGTCRDSYAYESSPVKSASRNVGIAKFPVDENPVSQDLYCLHARYLSMLSVPTNLLYYEPDHRRIEPPPKE